MDWRIKLRQFRAYLQLDHSFRTGPRVWPHG
jgi:hypothetical protein